MTSAPYRMEDGQFAGAGAVRIAPVHFAQEGLLWLINAQVFHARGMALILDAGDEPHFVLVKTKQDEPVVFSTDPRTAEAVNKAYRSFNALVDDLRKITEQEEAG